jgi:hypothetical protein
MPRNNWDLESVFVAGIGVAMAVLFAVAPFVPTKQRTGETVLEQARAQEQICQTITADEARTLKATRRC